LIRRDAGHYPAAMTRVRVGIALVGLCTAALVACSTYRDDLDRAVAHYNENQYEAALSLFEVLELDLDSLSPKERAEYAYNRGMTHFRLSQRLDARHWLGIAAASEKQQKGSLTEEEMKRLNDVLDGLNKERYGLAESPAAAATPCKADADCGEGKTCTDGKCSGGEPATAPSSAATAGPSETPTPSGKSCTADADCSAEKKCETGRCVYR
jgi:hypothetical protein